MADQWYQQPSQLPLEARAPGSRIISAYRNRVNISHDKNQVNVNSPHVGRVRSNTQTSYSTTPIPQNQVFTIMGEQNNRSRSSSWPNKPLDAVSPSPTHVHRTRSGSRPATPQKNSEPTTPRKKRKRLNPQRRSFYKALHNDFPSIAEALREARQGNCVLDSLRSREIFFTIIEARPPQDPTNLNVRRYDDMVFIWDPSMESWLQVPGNSQQQQYSATEIPPLSPSRDNNIINPQQQNSHIITNSASATQQQQQYLPSFNLSPRKSYFPDTGVFTYEGPFVSDSSQSEDEDFNQEFSRSLNDFLPMNIINDVL